VGDLRGLRIRGYMVRTAVPKETRARPQL